MADTGEKLSRFQAEIDKEIKQYYYEQYRRDGKIEL